MVHRRPLLLLAPVLLALVTVSGGVQESSLAAGPAAEAGTRTVLLVRHAEKLPAGGADPGLSSAGDERALLLAALAADAGVTNLFASEYRRTQATLAPLATQSELAVEVRRAREPGALVAELRALAPGSVAVVAGHSNTVPALVRALGGDAPEELAEDEYDRLFVVTLGGEACGVTTLALSYGD